MCEQEADEIYRNLVKFQNEILPTVMLASEIFAKNNFCSVMDLGCCTGRHTVYLARQGFHVYAADVSETGIEIARSKITGLGLHNVDFKQHGTEEIPFNDDSLDGILCLWTKEQERFQDVKKNINEIYRVLRPNGIVVMDYELYEEEHCSIPYSYSSREEIIDLYQSFTRVDITPSYYKFIDGYGNPHIIKTFVIIAMK
jgi:ubiquinone/menaquinone biosynthesis C-methylase UbiE